MSRFRDAKLQLGTSRAPSTRLFGIWLTRPRRILLAVAAIWVVGIFDLAFTVAEANTSHFVELNPLAEQMLRAPLHILAAYKFGLLTLGTVILLGLRRHYIAELAAWFLLATKFYLAIRWFSYFDCLVGGYSNPLIEAP